MRLFVAVTPPGPQCTELEAAIGLRDEQLRWVAPEQWHLTLVFCGEVEERLVPELIERLHRAAARTAVFPLSLHGGGSFPKQAARARVLWTGVGGDTATLSRLAERCSAAARRCGIPVEDRAFRPHLTLARARRDTADVRDYVARMSSYDGTPWEVMSMRLVHSTLGASVRHETLAELRFGEAS